jgi:4,5:9,10-diseco-3-hydroxy-5,9,17-trioxoandrosta-1(10),2-diene-4-oate hydrolase
MAELDPGSAAVHGACVPPARAAVGAAAPHRELLIDGVRLTCGDDGAGPAVVCLHAIGHGAGDFTRLRAHLRERYRVVAIDWPGQGRSGDDHVPASAVRYAELLGGALNALGIERAVLVGNSIGGAAAMRYAAASPARVAGLILENPGGLDAPDRLARIAISGMVRFLGAGVARAGWFPTAFAAYYRMVLQRRSAAEQRARIVASAFEIAPVLHEAWRSFGEPAADLRAAAATIRCPVLFAWAARDQIIQLRRSLPAIRRIARAQLRRFPAGHAAHLETPDAFEAAVSEFLSAVFEGLMGHGVAA